MFLAATCRSFAHILLALFVAAAAHASGDGRPPLPAPEQIAALPEDGGPDWNRLVFEQSPYLLQHAANPVDWYPWGDEAFARASSEETAHAIMTRALEAGVAWLDDTKGVLFADTDPLRWLHIHETWLPVELASKLPNLGPAE